MRRLSILTMLLPVLLVAIEIGLRLALRWSMMGQISGAFRDDPVMGFSLAPHLSTRIDSEKLGVHFTMDTNASGFRGRELAPRRPGECRLLVLGDSFAYGFGVVSEESFPAVLEKLLTGPDVPRVSVYNYGVPSFGTVQELALYRHSGPEVDADAVILQFFDNDFHENVVRYQYVDGFLMEEPVLFFGHPLFVNEFLIKDVLGIRTGAHVDELSTARTLLTEMKELAESRNQPLLVAYIPHRERTRFAVNGEASRPIQQQTLPEVSGLAALDLRPVLETASATPFSADGHLSPLGHLLVAEALVPWSAEMCREHAR